MVEVVRSSAPGHLTGWLINCKTGNKYVFSIRNDKISFTRELSAPTNIPPSVANFIMSVRDSLAQVKT